jgi:hypothetical protein
MDRWRPWDVANARLIGNFPQAFTHLTLVQATNSLGLPGGDVAARYAQPHATRTDPAAQR